MTYFDKKSIFKNLILQNAASKIHQALYISYYLNYICHTSLENE